MKFNIKSLGKKAIKSADPKQINKLSLESLNKVVGGVSFSVEAEDLGCCRYRYSTALDVLSSTLG
jgi:hypothetical protein